MPEMVPARRLSLQTCHQDQGQDCRHLRPDHPRTSQGQKGHQDVSSQDWGLHPDVEVKDFGNLDQPVDLQKPRVVKEEIKVSAFSELFFRILLCNC